jgi:two-component system response regulator FlrC
MESILIVDDEPSMRAALMESLLSCGYRVETAVDGNEGMEKFRREKFSLVITDMRMPKAGGMEVLRGVKGIAPETRVIVVTAYGTVKTAVEAMKEGASDFLMKPFSLDDLEMVVKNVMSSPAGNGSASADGGQEHEALEDRGGKSRNILSVDPKMHSMLEMLKAVAKSKASVFIQGESGTGKELIARFIHRHSNRSGAPFVAVNCAAVPHNLLESEMFGYEKGAFTGAAQRRIGKFETADGGTLLLDEVSEMDMLLQAKLLRALQESEIDRLGGREPVPVDVRIIATTNADLKELISEKKFREDLYYRLNVIPVKVPSLRERKGDIIHLAGHFLQKFGARFGKPAITLSGEARRAITGYSWPGNVRELENVIERAVLICSENEIFPYHLSLDGDSPGPAGPDIADQEIPIKNGTLQEMERRLIFDTLKEVNGNKTRASQILGISVRTMRNKLNEYKDGPAEQ